VIDPDGDHVGLEALRGLVVVGEALPMPPLDQLLRLGSLVVDLSQRAMDTRGLETRHVLELLAENRRR
jgi:hypothetical protein